jgi:hypothetical protein
MMCRTMPCMRLRNPRQARLPHRMRADVRGKEKDGITRLNRTRRKPPSYGAGA